MRCQVKEIKAHCEWKQQTWCGPRNSLGGPCYEKAARKQSGWVMSLGHSHPHPCSQAQGFQLMSHLEGTPASPGSLERLMQGGARRTCPDSGPMMPSFSSGWNSSHGLNPFGGCPFPKPGQWTRNTLCLQPC